MNRRIVVAMFAMVAPVLATQSILAQPLAIHSPVHATYTGISKPRMVTAHLRNDSTAPMPLKAGATDILLQPGKLTSVRVALGAKIVASADTPTNPAGTVLYVVDPNLRGAVISFK